MNGRGKKRSKQPGEAWSNLFLTLNPTEAHFRTRGDLRSVRRVRKSLTLTLNGVIPI